VIGGVAAVPALLGSAADRWASHRTTATVLPAVRALAIAALAVGAAGLAWSDLGSSRLTSRDGDHYLELRGWLAGAGRACDTLWVDAGDWRSADRWLPMYTATFAGR
jgi:hypothetical protein